ncbi:ABC transporter substrate-binding protein [Gulosibacter molinativorax]|uniref:ABC transporter substrate-binding protein n=1 Tax=Gulosibacter molinativorax TaxID=256821 RepID=A0ABT7C7M3_9MICO|nr:ABC transporter substrate-binding protein [Gulosibacter molinativorax]MDJ1371195.1 ABC transporter substrate-binding protein [Gulosibacter molinativorax]QUY63010.1 Taurine ABC transporter substrate-binding protein [Gulosibacter molinativorax]
MSTNRFPRALKALATTAVAALALVGCQAGSPGASETTGAAGTGEPLTIGLTYTPNIQFAPFYVAEELGYFDEAGVNVELRHHGESEELFGALKTGDEQLVYAGGDEIVQGVSGGVPVQSVATLYNTYPAVLIVPADSDIQSAADLAGHSVGTPGPYGQTYFALLAMLEGAGLSEADVDVQHIGFTQQAALSSGKVDAVMGFANNDAVQFAAQGMDVRVIEAVDSSAPTLVGPALGAETSVIAERGSDVTAVLGAVKQAIEYIAQNPDETIEISASYIPTMTTQEQKDAALATLEATIPLMEADGDLPLLTNNPDTWAAMTEFMLEAGIITEPVAPEDAFTNELLP